MKSIVLGIGVGVVVAFGVLVGSCSVSHRSQEFTCNSQQDCNDHAGTVCQGGFCIVPGSIDAPGGGDGPKGDGPGSQCPSTCTSCNVGQKTCTIDCAVNAATCNGQVACPAGYHCDIKCDVDGSCRNGVTCVGGASCSIECDAHNSCQNVECGTGPCDISCAGSSSCQRVSCGSSCACDVLCTGIQSCQPLGTVTCTSPVCNSTNGGCTSTPTVCHSCM